jgi:selenocysteine lyase/cysteine desulfurase
LNIREAASRYESGSQNLVGFIGLLGSLQTLHQFGLRSNESAIGNRITALTDDLCHRLNEMGLPIYTDRATDDVKSGIVSFDVPGFDSLLLKSQLYAEGVVLSCRGGRLRVAAHAYNNEADLDRMMVSIGKLTGR